MKRNKNRIVYLMLSILTLLVIADVYFIFFFTQEIRMSDRNRRELAVLDEMAENRLMYREQRKHEIDSVMLQLHMHEEESDSLKYEINKQMLIKTQTFSYEDAKQFANKLRLLSAKLDDDNLIAEARILSSYYLAQSCLFVESLEQLNSIDPDNPSLSMDCRKH